MTAAEADVRKASNWHRCLLATEKGDGEVRRAHMADAGAREFGHLGICDPGRVSAGSSGLLFPEEDPQCFPSCDCRFPERASAYGE